MRQLGTKGHQQNQRVMLSLRDQISTQKRSIFPMVKRDTTPEPEKMEVKTYNMNI